MHRPALARHRQMAALLAIALAGLGLAACAKTASPSSLDTAADVQLTWWTGQSEDAEQAAEALAKEFTQLHPNVTIKASSGAPTTPDLLQKLTAAFASDTYPDVSYAYGAWMGRLADSGKTLDFTEKVTAADIKWDEFPEPARITASPGGRVVGFPALVDVLSLVYNKTLFDEKGLAYPTKDWTWQDFREASKALTDPSRQIVGTSFLVSGDEDAVWRLWPQVWQNGGAISDADGNPTFDSPAGAEALELWRQMTVDDQSVYLDNTGVKHIPMFASGKMGMIITGPWSLYDITQGGVDYGVTFLPGTDGDHQSISGPDIWAAFDHGDPNRAYWTFEFLAWLTSADVDKRWSIASGNLPLRSSEKASPEFATLIETYPGMDVMEANLEAVVQARPTHDSYVTLSRNVGEAISQVLQGGVSPQEALSQAAAKTRDAMAAE